jgi:hypothetical protein
VIGGEFEKRRDNRVEERKISKQGEKGEKGSVDVKVRYRLELFVRW